MTNELEPLDIWDDATNAVCQSMQENKMCNCPDGDCLASKIEPSEETMRHWNTRAVPDVPELVRYDPNGKGYPWFEMEKGNEGDYVLYSQAAEIIAEEQQKTKDAEELAFRMDRFAKKYLSHMRNAEQRAEAAEAKLAKLEGGKNEG